MIAGSEAQKQKLLPPMIDGSRIGTVALAEGIGNPRPEHIKATRRGDRAFRGRRGARRGR
jgi:alkylation response protein AidB-like acyl-CoA dehydrogenase